MVEKKQKASIIYNVRSYLEVKGIIIGPNDIIIASIVKANNGVLITNNTKEFARVKGLNIMDWSL